jgi:hypothetical protein
MERGWRNVKIDTSGSNQSRVLLSGPNACIHYSVGFDGALQVMNAKGQLEFEYSIHPREVTYLITKTVQIHSIPSLQRRKQGTSDT